MSANAFGQTLAMRLSPTVHHPIRIALGISLTAACAIGAWAEEAKPREFFADQPKGLGEHFTGWKLNYVGEVFGNLSGGPQQGAIYEGYVKLGLGINLEKLAGWKDTVFYANFLYPHGGSLTQNYVGDLNVVSNIDAYDSARLFKCWVQKNFAGNRFLLRAGIMAVDKEFFVSEGAGLFLNSGFGAFPVIGQDLVAPVYPVSAPGVRLLWKASKVLSFRAAVFSGDVGAQTVNQHNTRWNLRASNGVSAFLEAVGKVNATGDGLPGTYKLGGFYDSKSFDDLRGGAPHHGNYGVYAIADQRVWREGPGDAAAQGLGIFARFALAPQDRSFVAFDCEGGATYTGLLPGRDGDVLGLGVLYAKVSKDARDDTGTPWPTHHETVIEVSYQASINDWLSVQPDFQYIFNPGAVHGGRAAAVAGLRFSLSF